MTASQTDIVSHLLNIDSIQRFTCNWGMHPEPSFWDVDDDTYINGIVMTIDKDYILGSLLEIVERSSGVVSYLAVVEFHGPVFVGVEIAVRDWDAEWYPNPVGTFFDRNISQEQACAWAVGKIHGLIDSWYDRKRATSERTLNAITEED
jgi:hypothetical protein